jgi:hypothetical protein
VTAAAASGVWRRRRLQLQHGSGCCRSSSSGGGCKGRSTAAAPTPAPREGGLFASPLCFQSPEIAAAALCPCYVFSSALALFSLLLSVFNLQRFATCCINCLLIAHCRDCCSLTVNINESAGSAAAPVHVDDYDSMADPKRRAWSNDLGWKYEYWTENGNRDKVTCNLCKTVTAGGIKRLKEHLACGYADTVMCSKTTTVIRKEMRAYLQKNKRSRPIFLDDESGHNSTMGTTQRELLFSQTRGQLLKGGE